MGYATDYISSVDTTASPRRQLAQVARECCYDEDLKRWWTSGAGTSGIGYDVLLNQNDLLSVGYQMEYQGLTHPYTEHLTFDLRTGRRLTLADLVADSPAQLGCRLQAAMSNRLRDKLTGVAAGFGDSTQLARVSELYELEDWNITPQRGLHLDTAHGAEADVTDFALRPDAFRLFHHVGMSRYNFQFLPDERYGFPFARLQLRPLLQPVVQANKGEK
ncbi:hypothetical protein [Hymenobacter glacieicola]|uniref:Uncharacterized protein n=1 Tax=Hymenobacter glacieicola TaxID=1562124 RepID=A0ABQ1X0J7_9BACT|nr:hypothetical protein [Hymenobacter glacieicola]GGG53993.1 hypothetical protein GCM10011378_32730 [Hymenobacter glacieicola]